MKALEKINLIQNITNKIHEQLQDESEIEFFLRNCGVLRNQILYGEHSFGYDPVEKYLMVKDTLLNSSDEDILKKMADELEISQNLSSLIKKYPENWKNSNNLKLFISHSDKNKKSAIKLKTALIEYKIDGFVAHEDIKTSKAWRDQIKYALNTMDVFVSIVTDYFNQSHFCQQELGFAVSRNVDIIQLCFDKNKKSLPCGLGEEIQFYIPTDLSSAVDRIIQVVRDSEKISELYNRINPTSKNEDCDDIPF